MSLSSPSDPSDLRPGPALRWPYAGWLGPVAYAYLGYAWWQVSIDQMSAAVIDGTRFPLPAAAALAVASRVAGWLIECGYYAAWWRWRGRTLPYWRFFHWTAALSTVDLLADAIRRGSAASPVTLAAKAWLIGPRVTAGLDASTWTVAFGGAGILTLLRLAMVAHVQRQALGLGWRSPALLVVGTWVAGRLVMAWSHDLMSGPSLR